MKKGGGGVKKGGGGDCLTLEVGGHFQDLGCNLEGVGSQGRL